ncbi:retrovirus-related pol polyprotein from transposon TNT 1-94, partial [Tanacetum coccineum]
TTSFYDDTHKQALSYQKSFHLKKGQRIQPSLYDGRVIAKEHAVISVIDDEDTLILEEESRSKMLDKQNDPISLKKKIKISPIDYSKLNKLKEDFAPVTSHTPVRIEASIKLPKSVENSYLNAQLLEKVFAIIALKNELRKLKGKNVVDTAVLKPNATITAGITQNPSEPLLEYACMFTKYVQDLLVYVSQTCPNLPKPSEKLVAFTSINKDKRVRFAESVISSSNIPKKTDSLKTKDSNKTLLNSTGVKPTTSASRSKPSGNTDYQVAIKRIKLLFEQPIRRIHQGRYGVYVPALTKDYEGTRSNMPYPEKEIRRIQATWDKNILEDIKRGPYSKKPLIRRIQDFGYAVELTPDPINRKLKNEPKIEDKDSFELKGQFLKELCDNTFSGLDHKDANKHIEKVLEIMDLLHIINITIDQVMLRSFSMSLTGVVSRWLRNKPSGLITTCEDLKTKFLSNYCPPTHTAKKMEEINNFHQKPDENLYQAWEQFKELLMKCPQHYLTEMKEVVFFYNGLDVPTRQILDSRGAISSKTVVD